MMTLKVDDFIWNTEEEYWTYRPSEDDFDIFVGGEAEGLDPQKVMFVNQALQALPTLKEKAEQYVGSFVDKRKAGIGSESSLVTLQCRYKGDVVRVEINYKGDRYGLWFVELVWRKDLKWWPISFGRSNW